MTAVAEKPKAKTTPKKTPAKAAPAPWPSEDQALFAEVGAILNAASGTDEDHEFSGESDRLLSIAAKIAMEAAKGNLSNSTIQSTGFDVAACINAARLVPDDSESVERTVHIDNAAQRLEIITGTAAHRMIFTDVQRPTVRNQDSARAASPAPAAARQFTEDQYNQLYWQAYVHMDCAKHVLLEYAERADSEEVFALRDLLDVYREAAHAKFADKEAGDLISGPLPDLSADLSKIISLLHAVNDDGRDDGVLHGVNYLLLSAKRIADGDQGVLQ